MNYKLLSYEREGDHGSDSTKYTTANGVDTTLSTSSYVHQDKQNVQDTQLLILDHAVVASHPPANNKDDCDEKASKETDAMEKSDKIYHRHFAMLGGIIGICFGILGILSGVGVHFLLSIYGNDHVEDTAKTRILLSIIWAFIVGAATFFVFAIFHTTASASYALNNRNNCSNDKGEDNLCCSKIRNNKRTNEFPRKFVYAFEGAFMSGSILGNYGAHKAIQYLIDGIQPLKESLSTSLGRVEFALDYTGILFAVLVYNVYPIIALEEDKEEERKKNGNKENDRQMLIV